MLIDARRRPQIHTFAHSANSSTMSPLCNHLGHCDNHPRPFRPIVAQELRSESAVVAEKGRELENKTRKQVLITHLSKSRPQPSSKLRSWC